MQNNYALTEQALRAERFLRRYKLIIIFIITAILLLFAGNKIYAKYAENKALDASELYFQAISGEEVDFAKLQDLNPSLALAAQIILSAQNAENAAKFATNLAQAPGGQKAVRGNFSALNEAAALMQNKPSAFLQDLSELQKAYELALAGDKKTAAELARAISPNSNFSAAAAVLAHYGSDE